MIRIIKKFLSQDEMNILNKWTLNHYDKHFFQDPMMDAYYEKTRLTTRNSIPFSKEINFPQVAFDIQKRIETALNITHPIYPQANFRNGIVNGIGFENGSVHLHKDPRYYPNTVTIHCNFLTQKSIDGGITIIENQKYDIDEGDLLIYCVSELSHEVTKIVGKKERILWCYGFCIEFDLIKNIF